MKRLISILALVAAAITANAQPPAGNVAHGKELYVKYSCYACHGFSGQNGPGARLVPMRFSQSGFIAYVRNPPRANQMPSYSARVLPDSDMADLFAYIKSIPDTERPARDIPLLTGILSQNP